jgi:hypothetical protein
VKGSRTVASTRGDSPGMKNQTGGHNPEKKASVEGHESLVVHDS